MDINKKLFEIEDLEPLDILIISAILEDQITDDELVNKFHVSKSTISRSIKKLNEKGYINKYTNGNNRILEVNIKDLYKQKIEEAKIEKAKVKNKDLELVKDIFNYDQEVGGEVAVRILEYLFTGESNSNNQLVNYIVDKHFKEVKDTSISVSRGQDRIKYLLFNNNIPFKQEYTVNINGHKRRFDFVVYGEEGLKYFIEYDGEQHYQVVEQWGGEEGLKERQRVDEEKNKYCRERGIPLIRIPYSIVGGIELKDLEVESSEFII